MRMVSNLARARERQAPGAVEPPAPSNRRLRPAFWLPLGAGTMQCGPPGDYPVSRRSAWFRAIPRSPRLPAAVRAPRAGRRCPLATMARPALRYWRILLVTVRFRLTINGCSSASPTSCRAMTPGSSAGGTSGREADPGGCQPTGRRESSRRSNQGWAGRAIPTAGLAGLPPGREKQLETTSGSHGL